MIPMRFPVTRKRRCVQITALGASDVPDVKMRLHNVSGPGSIPASVGATRAERVVEVGAELRTSRLRVVGVAVRCETSTSGRPFAIGSSSGRCRGSVTTRSQSVCCDVAQEVLVAAGVVEPDHRRARERRTTEREEVVGRVVEQHPDVRASRRAGRSTLEEQVREPMALGDVLGVRPHPVPEAQRRTIATLRVVGVRREQRRRVGRGHRRLTGRGTHGRGLLERSSPGPFEEHDRDLPVGRLLVLGVRGEELDEARPVLGALGRRRVARTDVDLLRALLDLRLGMRLQVQVPGGVRVVAAERPRDDPATGRSCSSIGSPTSGHVRGLPVLRPVVVSRING